MSIWLLWFLIVVIPNIQDVSAKLAFLSGLLFFMWLIGLVLSNIFFICDEEKEVGQFHEMLCSKWFAALPCVFALFLTANILTPDREQIAYIVSGYFVTNIEDVEKLPPNLVRSANKFLEDYATEAEKGLAEIGAPEVEDE